jgi:hypothetical protein
MEKILFFDRHVDPTYRTTPDLHPFSREDEYVERDGRTLVRCGRCGVEYGVGDSPVCKDSHGRVLNGYGDGFLPHFDIGLGREVTGWGDVRQAMRDEHLDFRDHPNPGDTSARMDRIAEKQRRART